MKTFCPQCVPDTAVDEDGCCVHCGATAIGETVDELNEERGIFSWKNKQITELLTVLQDLVYQVKEDPEYSNTAIDLDEALDVLAKHGIIE